MIREQMQVEAIILQRLRQGYVERGYPPHRIELMLFRDHLNLLAMRTEEQLVKPRRQRIREAIS